MGETEAYKSTSNREIIRQNQEAYFTNNIVTKEDVDFNEWVNEPDTDPSQIYIDFPADRKLGTEIESGSENSVQISSLCPNRVRIIVENKVEGYLVLLQCNYPGWNVFVDGEKGQIENVDRLFLGTYLLPGKHEVEFRFQPIDFYVGAIITAFFYIISICYVFVNTFTVSFQIYKRWKENPKEVGRKE